MAPSISVIMPVYNGRRTVASAIRSILQQTYPNFELLVMDDGSTDGTSDIVRSFDDPRVRLFRDSRNQGTAVVQNFAIDQSRGEFIARMDADDLSFRNRFELQVAFLRAHPDVDLLSTGVVTFRNADGSVIGLLPHHENHEQIVAQPWRGFYMPHATWMGKADWFRKHRYAVPESVRSDDQELLLRAYATSRFHSLPDVLYGYRLGDYQLKRTLLTRKALLRAHLKAFSKRGQTANLIKSIGAALVKTSFDLLAAIPLARRLSFFRMIDTVPASVRQELSGLYAECGVTFDK